MITNRRPPVRIRNDLRAMLDMLIASEEMDYRVGIRYCRREIEALENELLYIRYGRTDVT